MIKNCIGVNANYSRKEGLTLCVRAWFRIGYRHAGCKRHALV